MPDCGKCREERGLVTIPYIAHESAMARMERTIKRLWVLILLMVVLFVGSNIAWIIYESQYETVEVTEVTQESDGKGTNNYIGGDGDITNGGETDGQDDTVQNP